MAIFKEVSGVPLVKQVPVLFGFPFQFVPFELAYALRVALQFLYLFFCERLRSVPHGHRSATDKRQTRGTTHRPTN